MKDHKTRNEERKGGWSATPQATRELSPIEIVPENDYRRQYLSPAAVSVASVVFFSFHLISETSHSTSVCQTPLETIEKRRTTSFSGLAMPEVRGRESH